MYLMEESNSNNRPTSMLFVLKVKFKTKFEDLLNMQSHAFLSKSLLPKHTLPEACDKHSDEIGKSLLHQYGKNAP